MLAGDVKSSITMIDELPDPALNNPTHRND